jgi:transposase
MLNLPVSVRVFVCTQATDMRRSFDGLVHLAEQVIRQDPFPGHLFVFFNRRSDRVKVLYGDRSGPAIWYKRLETGTFVFSREDGSSVEIDVWDLAMILEGIDAKGVRREKRYHHGYGSNCACLRTRAKCITRWCNIFLSIRLRFLVQSKDGSSVATVVSRMCLLLLRRSSTTKAILYTVFR